MHLSPTASERRSRMSLGLVHGLCCCFTRIENSHGFAPHIFQNVVREMP